MRLKKIKVGIAVLAVLCSTVLVLKCSPDSTPVFADTIIEPPNENHAGWHWESEGVAASTGVKWRTMGYAITTKKLSGNYEIPDNPLIIWVDAKYANGKPRVVLDSYEIHDGEVDDHYCRRAPV